MEAREIAWWAVCTEQREGLNCCTLLWGVWSLSSAVQARAACGSPSHDVKETQNIPALFLPRRVDGRPIRSALALSRANAMACWPSTSSRFPSPPHCSCPEWFYKHFARGSIPVLINHCESDSSKAQRSLELRDGRSKRERLQRGWRKRASLQPQWKGEEVQGKRSKSQTEAEAKLKAGFGQRCKATGIERKPLVIAFSLRVGGWGKLMTTALSIRVSDRWRNSAKRCVCHYFGLLCNTAKWVLHLHTGAWLHAVQVEIEGWCVLLSIKTFRAIIFLI